MLKAVINHILTFYISFSSIIFSLLLYTRLSFRGMSTQDPIMSDASTNTEDGVISEKRHKQILTENHDEKCLLLKRIKQKDEYFAKLSQTYKHELSLLQNEHKEEQKLANKFINDVCDQLDKVKLEVSLLIVL